MKPAARALFKSLLLCAAWPIFGAQAQTTYPDRPIKMIVPFSPGTGIDILARTVGQKMVMRMGQAVVVENIAGATGNIATVRAKQVKPDGYTLLMIAPGHVINPHVFKDANYDAFKDFTPVSMTAWGRLLLVVHPSTQITNVNALIKQAKAEPGKLTYATPGPGAPHHLAMEMFRGIVGVDILHVPYSSTAGAVTGILSGQVNAMFLPIHVAMPHLKAGKITALGLGSAKRSPNAPDIPTLAEQGIPGAEVDLWYGLLAPAGVSQDIVRSLHAVVSQALKEPDMRETLEKQGLEPAISTPEEFRVLMERESAKWGKVVRQANIKASALPLPVLASVAVTK
jgi:tripartite-type tricarboxylate transporter receptor subunit TctC